MVCDHTAVRKWLTQTGIHLDRINFWAFALFQTHLLGVGMNGNLRELELKAREAESLRNWEKSYVLWERLSSLAPLSPDQALAFARSAAFFGKLDRADELLGKISKGTVSEGQVAMLRADIAERRHDYNGALRWRQVGAKLLPDSYWIRFGIARAMNGTNQHSDSEILALMKAAMLLPGAERHGALFTARLLFKSGEVPVATRLLSRFVADKEERDILMINSLPGMTSSAERHAARELARNLEGGGKVIDLGCWLGSLSAALASGLKANKSAGRTSKVIAYDLFEWSEGYMERDWPGSRVGLKEDDDFLPWFKKMTENWKHWIDVRKCDLSNVNWSEGKISLLVVDAMKTEELARHIMATFYPSLLPGAHVFHQDFCHFHTWWIHLYHFKIRRKFKLTDTVDGSGTVVFQLLEPFSQSEVEDVLATDLSDAKLASDAFEHSLSLVSPVDRDQILRAYLNCEKHFGRTESILMIENRLSSKN